MAMKSKHVGRSNRPESEGQGDEFAAMLEQSFEEQSKLQPGTPVVVTVTNNKDQEFIFVKSEFGNGMVDREELLDSDGNVAVVVGEKVQGFFHSLRHGENLFTTRPSGDVRSAVLTFALENQTPIRGRVARKIKGGFEVEMGDVTAFCPASQMDSQSDDPSGTDLDFLITEVSGRRVIASRRAFRDQRREAQKQVLAETLQEGDVVTGPITSVQNFGAFVDLDGVEGLIPVSELAFRRIGHPKEVVQSGQEVRVKVLKVDWKEERITLSLRALLDNPWQGQLPFDTGDIVEGEIESIKNFGMFVRLPDHFVGLVPNAESGVPRGQRLDTEFKAGETLRVLVKFIDRQNEKISLSVKAVKDADDRREYQEYMDQNNEQPTEGISSFGAQLRASLEKDKK